LIETDLTATPDALLATATPDALLPTAIDALLATAIDALLATAIDALLGMAIDALLPIGIDTLPRLAATVSCAVIPLLAWKRQKINISPTVLKGPTVKEQDGELQNGEVTAKLMFTPREAP